MIGLRVSERKKVRKNSENKRKCEREQCKGHKKLQERNSRRDKAGERPMLQCTSTNREKGGRKRGRLCERGRDITRVGQSETRARKRDREREVRGRRESVCERETAQERQKEEGQREKGMKKSRAA